jgi:hypothetical protein
MYVCITYVLKYNICIHIYLSMHVCKYVRIHPCHMYVYIYTYMCMRVYICTYLCICMYIHAYLYRYACMCMYVCVCVLLLVYICLSSGFGSWGRLTVLYLRSFCMLLKFVNNKIISSKQPKPFICCNMAVMNNDMRVWRYFRLSVGKQQKKQ